MRNPMPLKTIDELEFVIFCIENLAARQGLNAREVYGAIANKGDLLHTYLIPGYEFLHTQDKEYILNDIEETMDSEGVVI